MNTTVPLAEIDNAIKKGGDFIRLGQHKDGLWRDFDTLAGPSSDWVTGFVSYALSNSGFFGNDEALLHAHKTLIFRQRKNGGWSYNEGVPTDCDSTSWVLLSLSTSPYWRPSSIKRGMRYIQDHQDELTGGYTTYRFHDNIHKFIQVNDTKMVSGWTSAHTDVTSVAIQALIANGFPVTNRGIGRAALFLIRQRTSFNIWTSYWWKGYAYSTYNALKCLLALKVIDRKEASRTLIYLISKQRKDGGWNDYSGSGSETFPTAFIILSLLLGPDNQTIASAEKGVEWLISNQTAEGSWATSPILKIPPPMIGDPDTFSKWRLNQKGTGVIIEDKNRLFSSTSALWALILFKRMVYDY